MTPIPVNEQMRLLDAHVSTEVWGIMPGTKSRRRFEQELRGTNVVLLEHWDGKGLVRIARRARGRIFYDGPEGRELLRPIVKRYPGGWKKRAKPILTPKDLLKTWSVTETRLRREKPKQAMKRGPREELRDEHDPLFRFIIEDEDMEQLSPYETYEEHQSENYPGIRTGNFDVSFEIICRQRNYRPRYRAHDHGLVISSGWVRI